MLSAVDCLRELKAANLPSFGHLKFIALLVFTHHHPQGSQRYINSCQGIRGISDWTEPVYKFSNK